MNKTLKYVSLGICGGILTACIVLAYIAGEALRKSCVCERLEVRVLDSLENHFITGKGIRMMLDRSNIQYKGVKADSLDLVKIEETIESRSAVLRSEAYVTKDGTLHIDITQRKPVVRFQKKDGGFYADAQGCIFPLQNSFASHVQIIDGHIPIAANSGYKGEIADTAEKAWFDRMMSLVNYIETSGEWKSKIVQIHVMADGDLMLIPRSGKERFIFGQTERLDEKFALMKKYYTAIVPEKGSDRYREVDLRFKGQIICR